MTQDLRSADSIRDITPKAKKDIAQLRMTMQRRRNLLQNLLLEEKNSCYRSIVQQHL